jgi:hypothetical protein
MTQGDTPKGGDRNEIADLRAQYAEHGWVLAFLISDDDESEDGKDALLEPVGVKIETIQIDNPGDGPEGEGTVLKINDQEEREPIFRLLIRPEDLRSLSQEAP